MSLHDAEQQALTSRLRERGWRTWLSVPLQPFPVLQDLPRRVVSGDSRHTAARVRRGTALIETINRGAVIRIMWRRALEKQLLERQLTVKDVPLRRVDDALDVMRQEHLAVDDAVAKTRRQPVDGVEHRLDERGALLVPTPAIESSRGMAAEQVDDVFPGQG